MYVNAHATDYICIYLNRNQCILEGSVLARLVTSEVLGETSGTKRNTKEYFCGVFLSADFWQNLSE